MLSIFPGDALSDSSLQTPAALARCGQRFDGFGWMWAQNAPVNRRIHPAAFSVSAPLAATHVQTITKTISLSMFLWTVSGLSVFGVYQWFMNLVMNHLRFSLLQALFKSTCLPVSCRTFWIPCKWCLTHPQDLFSSVYEHIHCVLVFLSAPACLEWTPTTN